MRIMILSSIVLLFSGCVSTDTPLPKINIDNNTSLTHVLEKMNFKKAGDNLYVSEQISKVNEVIIPTKNTGSYKVKVIEQKYKFSNRSFNDSPSYFGMGKYDQNLESICKAKGASMIYYFEDINQADNAYGEEFKFDSYLKLHKYNSVDDRLKKLHAQKHICKKNNSDDIVFLQLDYLKHIKGYEYDKYTLIDFSYDTLKIIKQREEDFKNYLVTLDKGLFRIENNKIQKEKEKERKQKEAKRKHEEALEQARAIKAQRITELRNRKGQYSMTFANGYSYTFGGYRDSEGKFQFIPKTTAEAKCRELYSTAFDENGYGSLQEALSDGWKFKSKIKEEEKQASEYCFCKGNTYILEK